MKNVPHIFLIVAFALLSACSSNSEEDLKIDCSQSDLQISIEDHTKPDCDISGSITVSGSGGTEPYTFSSDGINFQSSVIFNELSASTYLMTIKDVNNCTKQMPFSLQAGPNGITIEVVSKTSSGCLEATGSLQVLATGGDGIFTYSLDGGSAQEDGFFNLLSAGVHSIKVMDGSGCIASLDSYIESTVSLSDDITPIINTNCAISGCHNGTQFPELTSPDGIIQQAPRIKEETQARTMPRDGMLTQDEIDLIACWVDDGAKNN